jgi:hypothetical protein
VYHIGFLPKTKNIFAWTGEAYIDVSDFHTIRVFTNLSQRVPFVVRTVLGTDVSGFGYNVAYQPQQDGTWLPASYGTEYELRLFFRTNRTVSISMDTSFESPQKSSAN